MNGNKPVFFLVKNRALGDSIMGLSSVQYLRALYPNSTIIYAVPEWVAPLYKDVATDADLIYPLKLKSVSDVLSLYTDLINMRVDAIHEMHQSGRGHKVFSFFGLLKRIPYTFHNHHLKTKTKVIDQGVIKELIQRDLDGLYSFYGHGTIPGHLDYPPIMQLGKKTPQRTVIMGVVATRKTKMWPLENFVQLARLIDQRYPDFKVVIPLSKGPDDQIIKEQLLKIGLPSNTSIEHWSLNALPALFKGASFYIGNDTGQKHLAVAVGTKSYTFFGPEPAKEWHPYDSKKHPYFYREGLACRTRTHHYCGLSVCDLSEGHMQCLTFFKPEHIFLEIEKEFR
ncbi:MAG: glycosyltransferase family 9 protein [Bacteriovorax sp.]